MSEIAQRFNLDMLTLTGSVKPALAAQGIDVERDLEFMALVESDTLRDAYRLQMAAGAQVLVTATEGITPARLAIHRLEDRLEDLAVAALTVAESVSPQHILVEIGPCGLPLDASSAESMKEHRDQYVRVARVFEACDPQTSETGASRFDGYLLSGFGSVAALKAACAGIRKVSDRPLFVSVDVDEEGKLAPRGSEAAEDAICAAVEFGADVVGFATQAGPETAAAYVKQLAEVVNVPFLVQIEVADVQKAASPWQYRDGSGLYDTPESMLAAAYTLRQAGVQFLRSGGEATPAYTAVLAAATAGLDVVRG